MRILLFVITLLIIATTSKSKVFEVKVYNCYGNDQKGSMVFIDSNNDAIFDTLKIHDCGYVFTEVLDSTQTVGQPPLNIYKGYVKFNPIIIHHDEEKDDVYFQVQLIYDSKIIGYWERLMGSNTLYWRD